MIPQGILFKQIHERMGSGTPQEKKRQAIREQQ
jgi:hypothetical protein